MHLEFGVEVEKEQSLYLYTRDEVLAHIKSFLQPYYDCGVVPRECFVLFAKQALLFVMNTGSLSAQRYSKAFVEQTLQLQLQHLIEIHTPVFDSVKPASPDRCGNTRRGEETVESHESCVNNTPPTQQKKREVQEQEDSSDAMDGGIRRAPVQGPAAIIKPHRVQSSLSPRNALHDAKKRNNDNPQYYYSAPFSRHPVPESHASPTSSSHCSEASHENLQPKFQQQQQQLRASFDGSSPSRRKHQTAAKRSASVALSIKVSPNSTKLNARDGEGEPGTLGDSDGEVRHQGESENGALLSVIRQLRTRVTALNTSSREESELESGVVVNDGMITTPLASETNASCEAVLHTGGPSEREVADIANVCLARYAARREILEQWAYERQDLLRTEDNEFTALLLRLQHSIIQKLARYVHWEKEPTTTTTSDGRKATSSPPPPPLTPPPKVQFVSTGETSECESGGTNEIEEREGGRGKAKGTLYLNLFRNSETPRCESPVVQGNHRSGSLIAPRQPRRSSSIPTKKSTKTPTGYVPRPLSHDALSSAPCTPNNTQCSRNSGRRVYRLHSPTTATRRTRSAGQSSSVKAHFPDEREERAVMVEFLRKLLQPAFNSGILPAARMADIVQRATRGLHEDLKEEKGSTCVRTGTTGWQQKLRKRVELLIGEELIGK